MNKMFKLAVIFMKSFGDSVKGKTDKVKKFKKIAMYSLITLAMLPTAFGIGAIAYAGYNGLETIGQGALILGLGMTIVTTMVFFFGIFYVLSVYYFSKDVEHLLPLPLTSGQIVGAKFIVTLVFEYLTELVILLPVIIGYGLASQAGIWYYISGFIVFFLLPVPPLSMASIIDMLIMSFTNIAKNKDRFRMFSAIFGIMLALGINFGAQKIGQDFSSPEVIQKLMAQGDNSLLVSISRLFPTNRLATYAMISEPFTGLLYLIGFLAAMAAFFGVFYWLSGLLYFKGAVGINESSSTRKKLGKVDFDKETSNKGMLRAVYMKEIRLLYRNPGYFVNCVLMNFLFPFFLLLPFITGGGMNPESVAQMQMVVTNPGATFLAAAFITATNSIASSAISREGKLLYISKFLPINPKTQLNGKLLSALVFGAGASVMLIGTEFFVFNLNVLQIVIGLAICLIATLFTAIAGLLLDITFPKLNWDNELKAVKQNLNVLFMILLTVIVGGATTFLMFFLNFEYLFGSIVVFLVFLIINFVLYAGLMTKGAKAYSKLEV